MKLFKTSIIFTISFLILAKEAFADNIDKLKLCENTIESVELQTDIPKGLLLGIGKAEAIRKINNKYIIWPWTINHAGKSLFFDTKKQMTNYVFKNLKRNDFNIDVGCMPSGVNPILTYAKEKNVCSLITTKSQAIANETPAPAAPPSIAEIIGFEQSYIA